MENTHLKPRKKSPIAVEQFLAGFPPDIQKLALELRTIVKAECLNASETVYLGWRIVAYAEQTIFCYIAPHQDKVALGFNQGRSLPDPGRLLQGQAKHARNIFFRPDDQLPKSALRELIEAAQAFEQFSNRT
jgi:hypothetical protein